MNLLQRLEMDRSKYVALEFRNPRISIRDKARQYVGQNLVLISVLDDAIEVCRGGSFGGDPFLIERNALNGAEIFFV